MKKFTTLLLALSFMFISIRIYADEHRFNRRFDPIIIQGSALAPFIGYNISDLRLYKIVLKDGTHTVQPIPFQIDEQDAYGNWLFNYDRHGNPIPLKRTSLAPQDELVFMSKDAGIKLIDNITDLHRDKIIEIELTDPVDNAHAYVYLAFFKDDPPPLSPVKYVRYDPVKDRVYGKFYTMGFSKEVPISYDYFAVPESEGGKDINIFDRFKMRLDVSTYLFNFRRNEDDFKSRLVGYIQGPVRAIRRVANSMDIILGIQSPSVLSDSIYYYDYFQFPTIVNIPIDLQRLYIVKKARLVTSTDFNQNAIGMYFYNSNNPGGFRITGKMSPAQEHLNMSPYDWAVVSGPQGVWMNRVVMAKNIPFTKNLYFMDDETRRDPPENDPGQIANTGYDFGNLMKSKKGIYTFTSYIYVPVGYTPGDEVPWLNIIDHPVTDVIYYNNKQVVPVQFTLKEH